MNVLSISDTGSSGDHQELVAQRLYRAGRPGTRTRIAGRYGQVIIDHPSKNPHKSNTSIRY